jgi:HEAT repeat protein
MGLLDKILGRKVDIKKLEEDRDIKRLIKELPGSNYWGAAEALGRLRAEEAVQPLMDLFQSSDNCWARREFINALGEIGDPKAIPVIRNALADNDSSVRSAAGRAIVKIQSGSSSDKSSSDKSSSDKILSLIDILTNNKYNWETRENAAIHLSKLGKPAVESLVKLLKHNDSEVRWQAAEALGKIGDKRALESLIPLLNDNNDIVRLHAALAIGKLNDKRAISVLIKNLDGISGYVLWDSIDILGDFKDASAVEPLIKHLNNSDNKARQKAAIALGKIRDKRAIEPLTKLLKDNNEEIKKAAEESLKSI